MRYNFFYDESEHSRKINHNTVTASNFGVYFVCSIIGFYSDKNEAVLSDYNVFEESYRNQLQVTELKSDIIKPKHILYGLATLNKNNKMFVKDFLHFFVKHELYLYFAAIHKIEYLIKQMFSSYKNSYMFDMDSLRYILTKVIDVYRPEDVIKSIYRDDGSFIECLTNFIEDIISQNAGLIHKNQESKALKEAHLFLEGYEKKYSIDWNYNIAFEGFKKYLSEKGIDNYTLIIDREGNGKTLESAQSVGLINLSEVSSTDSTGVRIADVMTGVISKINKAIDNDLRYHHEYEHKKLKYLNKKWFIIDEEILSMYKLLSTIILHQNKAWYKAYSGNYSDSFICFLSLMKYFESFKSINDFIKVSLDQHRVNVNNATLASLEEHYRMKRSKLPIDFVNSKNEDFYINKKGALVYFDYKKHDILPMKNDPDGTKYKVLSVGFFGKMEMPCVTVEEEKKIMLYLLPNQLIDWVIQMVSLANQGTDIFPSNVLFRCVKGKYYVDVI